jgi:phosphoserine aminotransferase
MSNRASIFYAGPSVLPIEVLEEISRELVDYKNSGISLLEISHRSSTYEKINEKAIALLRELLNIPSNYHVLFVQGGGTLQFGMIPLNFLAGQGFCQFAVTGAWSKKACEDAEKIGKVDVIFDGKSEKYQTLPKAADLKIDSSAAYFYMTSNETIGGVQWKEWPNTGDVPLICDMSSDILSRHVPVEKFALIFAGAQKNLGPAGVTLVIIRDDILERAPLACAPTMLQYKTHAENGSMYNTPPCYSVYMVGKVLKWVQKNGGAEGMKKRNTEKAELLYTYLDSSAFYKATAQKDSRSLMNIPFVTREAVAEKAEVLNKAFVSQAAKAGLINLAGHRLVGGMRASIYNAMSIDGVKTLIAFMDDFAKKNS